MVRAQGLQVDEDNDLAPKNVPTSDEVIVTPEQEWGWNGICHRKSTAAQNHRPSIIGVHGLTLEVITLTKMSLIFNPRKYIETVAVKLTNENISSPLTVAEFLRY